VRKELIFPFDRYVVDPSSIQIVSRVIRAFFDEVDIEQIERFCQVRWSFSRPQLHYFSFLVMRIS
jgi:hypothetical protein